MGMTGAELIRVERIRQIHSEGYDARHDKGHAVELISAAVAYLINYTSPVKVIPYSEWEGEGLLLDNEPLDDLGWPWAPEYWKPTSTPRDLTKAGALIAAAIDSLEAEDA